MREKPNVGVSITQADLQNPYRLNQVLELLAAQIVKLQGNAGPQTFQDGPFAFSGAVSMNAGAQVNGEVKLTGVSDRKGNTNVMRVPKMSIYADNTAALAGGMRAGDFYVTATGVVMRVY